ncbi:sensor histidine kinase [Micromonospora sp. MS34]|uniref:sensor histidine kinase n=1 Tax=Micromonospora sp. MS34 TaxID=3385971 RepID=UPI00399F546F
MASIVVRLRPPAWVPDIGLALLVAWFQVRGTQLVGLPAQTAMLDRPGHLGYVLLAGSGLVLAGRRRWPVAVFAAVAATNAIYYLAHYADGPSWTALFVAAYTLTAQAEHSRVRVAAVAIASLSVVWLATADLRPLLGAGWVFFRIGTAVMAAALGESVRARRVITAQALARAELAERTRDEEALVRVTAERLRIAREVHDTVAHAIAVINVQAGVTAHVLDKRCAQARETLMTIEATSARALGELRATLAMLRDTGSGCDTATPGLARLTELTKVAEDVGLHVQVNIPGLLPDLPDEVDRAAYRVVQEAITNAIRHAGPARMDILLSCADGTLSIDISDDGVGPPDAALRTESTYPNIGRGITGMRERCALLGGTLTAGPGPAGGFRIQARLPLTPAGCGSRRPSIANRGLR